MEVKNMFNSTSPSLADIAAVTGNDRNDGFGDNGAWWIIVFVLFFAFGGWNGNGWGGNGGYAGATAAAYTDSEIQRGFDTQSILGKLDGITNGICDGFYSVNNSMLTGFNGINTNVMQTGFGIQQAINADTVANMQNTNALQSQLANCCCETREAIQGVNYNMAQNTCALQNTMNNNTRDIIDSQNAGTRAILDYMCAKENENLRDKVQKLELAASQSAQNAYITANQEAQTAELIRRINPMPVPSYNVPAPYPYAGYGCNSNCGCNSGCGC